MHTIVQFDHRGQIVFQHRCQDKWRLGGNRFNESLANEKLCFDFVAELARRWSGTLWQNDEPTRAEKKVIKELTGKRAKYTRVGYDERTISFEASRAIGEGSAECERVWHVNAVDGQPLLTMSRLDRRTCHLRREEDGVWRGQWLEHERMPVELTVFTAY